jgi:hypothetical protein
MTFVSLPISPGAVEVGLVLFCLFMSCGILYGFFFCVWMTVQWIWPTRVPRTEERASLVETAATAAHDSDEIKA